MSGLFIGLLAALFLYVAGQPLLALLALVGAILLPTLGGRRGGLFGSRHRGGGGLGGLLLIVGAVILGVALLGGRLGDLHLPTLAQVKEWLTIGLWILGTLGSIALVAALFLLVAKVLSFFPLPAAPPRPTFRVRAPVVESMDFPDGSWRAEPPEWERNDELGLFSGGPRGEG